MTHSEAKHDETRCGGVWVTDTGGAVRRDKTYEYMGIPPDSKALWHWEQGPAQLEPFERTMKSSDLSGEVKEMDFEFSYNVRIARLSGNMKTDHVYGLHRDALHDSEGWARAGVRVRFDRTENIDCWIYVSEDVENPYTQRSSGGGPVSVHYHPRHLVEGSFWYPLIINHEVGGHAIFKAYDGYLIENRDGQGYRGNLDSGLDGTPRPTDKDIRAAKLFAAGRATHIA